MHFPRGIRNAVYFNVLSDYGVNQCLCPPVKPREFSNTLAGHDPGGWGILES